MKRQAIALGLVFLLLLTPSCATIINDTTIDFTIESEPAGATIEINGQEVPCKTPCTRKLKTNKDYKVAVTTEDGTSDETKVTSEVSAWWFANLILGTAGLIGMGIDYYTGAMYKLSFTGIEFDLTEAEDDDEAATKDVKASPQPSPSAAAPKPAAAAATPSALAPQNADETKRLEQLKETYPASGVDEQIRNYYGSLPPEDLANTRERIYFELLDQERRGEKPDIDDAIRMDHFR